MNLTDFNAGSLARMEIFDLLFHLINEEGEICVDSGEIAPMYNKSTIKSLTKFSQL